MGVMVLALLAQGAVSASLLPARVCVDPRSGYPNFDIALKNGGKEEAAISEVRGFIVAADGTLIERRILWQDALQAARPDTAVPAGGEALLFNPMTFRSAGPGKRLRVEVDAGGGTATAETVLADCAKGQPTYRMPIGGRVMVYDGADALSHHRRHDWRGEYADKAGIKDNFQRFGLDLVAIDAKGGLWKGDGKRTADWHGWGLPVRAAAAGTIAAVHDGQPDNVEIGTVDKWGGPALDNPMSSYGNYVLVDHGGGEFTLYGHMQRGSVKVAKGAKVAAGQPLGAMGNSGASGGVHLHFERRRGTGFGLAGVETQPVRVSGVTLADGTKGAVTLDTGDVVVGD